MTDTTTTTPSPTLDVTVNGKSATLFMSFGLLNRLLSMFGNEETAVSAFYDNELRPKVLEEVLKLRGQYGALEKVVVDDLDITAEHVASIFSWVSDHAVDFFIRNAEKGIAIGDKYSARAASLVPSQNGSQDSASKMPSAGPSGSIPLVSKD